MVTDEYCGRDGASQGLADVTPEADAVVTNGNGNQFVVLPKMERVIGDIETVRIITGGNVDRQSVRTELFGLRLRLSWLML